MREIIFRGKRIDNGEWVEGYYYKTREGNTRIHSPHTVFKQHFTVLLETVGQYTGLEDKNGKKIFEGDIIGAYGYDYDEPSFDEYGEVVFTPLGVAIYIEKDNGEIDVLYLCELQGNYSTQYEKFGNIHDNPELLEQ